MKRALPLIAAAFALASGFLPAQEMAHLKLNSPFASYVEKDFPFFTQTVDARQFGETPEAENLTPRGIVVSAGNGFYGCFDPDLLRWALFWKQSEEGEYLTMDGMGAGSYRLPNRKSAAGQKELPHPIGRSVLAMPLRPGVSVGKTPLLEDPRDRGRAEAGEIGLGPIPATMGRFEGLRLVGEGVQIEYTIGGTLVKETLSSEAERILRHLAVAAHGTVLQVRTGPGDGDWLVLPPDDSASSHRIEIGSDGSVVSREGEAGASETKPPRRWKESVRTGPARPPTNEAAWVYDDFPLPIPNPWKRNVRIADLEFFPDGRAAFVTFDGDVWIVNGILSGSKEAIWSRFASGLHEPQSLTLVDGVLHVFDRNGIFRLHDTDGNGEADWHECFSNVMAQSAETRNFPMDLIARPDGGFYIAMGGQIGTTIGKHNGTVIRITPDGKQFEVVATGLRQPYLGYDRETGLLTASDQQGNWKPATPIYRIEPGRYFGFQPETLKDKVHHPAPIHPAEVWIPHFINQSGAGQVWIKKSGEADPRMGALNGALVHLGFSRPEIFKIYLDPSSQQGAVVPLLSGFPSAILNGRIHPLDGFLYLTGLEVWGSSGERTSGLFRVRPGNVPGWLPREIRAEKRGILLRFDTALAADLVSDLGRYSADRWNYHQTHEYGSGNFRTDSDQPGQEAIPVSSAKLSKDGTALFLGIREMRPAHSLRLTYRVPSPEVTQVDNAYLTIHQLPAFDLKTMGFADNEVDLTPRADLTGTAAVTPTAALGREVVVRYGCIACHATGDPGIPAPPLPAEGGAKVAVGPPWIGLWGSKKVFSDGSELRSVDSAYLRESILDPARRVQEGYEMERTGVGMPSYLGVLKDHEIESVVMFIKGLKKKP